MGDPGAGELVNIDTGELISEFVNEVVPKPRARLYMRISSFGKLTVERRNMDKMRLCCAFVISEWEIF